MKKLFIVEGKVRILGEDEGGFYTKRFTHAEDEKKAEENIRQRLAKALKVHPEKINLIDCSADEISKNPQ